MRVLVFTWMLFLLAAASLATDRSVSGSPTEELEILLQQERVKTDTASLILWLRTAPPTANRWAAIEILGLRGAKEAVPTLRAIVEGKEDILLRETAALALARLGLSEGKSALRELVGASKDWVRQIFLAARLAELGDPSGYPYVAKAVSSPSVDVRFFSVAALVAFIPLQVKAGEEIDPIEKLQALARDESPKVRSEFLIQAPIAVNRGASRDTFKSIVKDISIGDSDPKVRELAGLILTGWEFEEPRTTREKREGP